MSAHSNVVGGSSAARFLNCPGSRAIIDSLPEAVDQPSRYATEGSALHQVVAELLLNAKALPEEYLGKEIAVKDEGHIEITQELISDCILPSLEWFDKTIPDSASVEVEARVSFPGIEGGFGTCDLIAHDPGVKTYVNDWKYGSGVTVRASYPDPDDALYEILNPQLMFYACSARHTLPHMFERNIPIELSIVQPRARDGITISTVTVTHADLDAFEVALKNAVALSEQSGAPMKIGEWCRFAVCKTSCPLHLAPMIDFAELYGKPGDAKNVARFATSDVLADILELAELIEPVIIEARAQAHKLLEAGGTVPGWKLVPKRAQRKWALDEEFILRGLRTLKIKKSEAYSYSLKSPAQIEKLLPKGKAIPENLVEKVSSGTTIAKSDDPRENAPTIGDVVNALVEAEGNI
jgi:Protein of unknown function (DUF2800)